MSAALVPVKSPERAKSRLGAVLSRGALEALSLAMLHDVVSALAAARRVDRVAVVTGDERVGEAARAAGGLALVGEDPGLNASLDRGALELGLEEDEPLLVVLGDVAAVVPDDIDHLFDALDGLGGRGAVIAPAEDGGTAALLRAPADVLPNRFGPDSAAAHRAAAEAAGTPCKELALPSLTLDLDRPEDVDHFLAVEGGGARTRALLAELDWRAAARP